MVLLIIICIIPKLDFLVKLKLQYSIQSIQNSNKPKNKKINLFKIHTNQKIKKYSEFAAPKKILHKALLLLLPLDQQPNKLKTNHHTIETKITISEDYYFLYQTCTILLNQKITSKSISITTLTKNFYCCIFFCSTRTPEK
eukprot:TRINITY_DN18475_c0_g2_i1.p4 TRINITY_DN18475_c0_g2~~TRINITY_DN18475_c0_g2_i1.p4  ORF type:complete len:141 (+),score=8.40 TRINITY_DN18475_c0_g2_i1:81-503(+)